MHIKKVCWPDFHALWRRRWYLAYSRQTATQLITYKGKQLTVLIVFRYRGVMLKCCKRNMFTNEEKMEMKNKQTLFYNSMMQHYISEKMILNENRQFSPRETLQLLPKTSSAYK